MNTTHYDVVRMTNLAYIYFLLIIIYGTQINRFYILTYRDIFAELCYINMYFI